MIKPERPSKLQHVSIQLNKAILQHAHDDDGDADVERNVFGEESSCQSDSDQLLWSDDSSCESICDDDELDALRAVTQPASASTDATFRNDDPTCDDFVLPTDDDGDDDDSEDGEGDDVLDLDGPNITMMSYSSTIIDNINRDTPIDSADADKIRFQTLYRQLLDNLFQWVESKSRANWTEFFTDRTEQREVGTQFANKLQQTSAAEIAYETFRHIPDIAQKILGTTSLAPSDLLELPIIPQMCQHRLTYVDVAVRVNQEDIEFAPSQLTGHKNRIDVKQLRENYTLRQTRCYVGSTVAKQGGWCRVSQHEVQIMKTGDHNTHRSAHYDFARQPDVVPNFRAIAFWDNPFAHGNTTAVDDAKRFMPVLTEALIMVFLGMLHNNWPPQRLFFLSRTGVKLTVIDDVALQFIDSLRAGISLPRFSDVSLNIAWPLRFGIIGGLARPIRCANAECGVALVRQSELCLDYESASVFFQTGGVFGPFICQSCNHSIRDNGRLRSRAGKSNGYFGLIKARINIAWTSNGGERKCGNESCGLAIPLDADVYGYAASMRCYRCHTYRREHKREWQDPNTSAVTGLTLPLSCAACAVSTNHPHAWDDQIICGQCYATRCVFNSDNPIRGREGKTHKACGNAGCPVSDTEKISFVEDTNSHIWRCTLCDWSYFRLGKELPEGFACDIKTESLEPGPVQNHRHNATHCRDCKHYVTPRSWTKNDDGTFLCDLCLPQCTNKYCCRHPALRKST